MRICTELIRHWLFESPWQICNHLCSGNRFSMKHTEFSEFSTSNWVLELVKPNPHSPAESPDGQPPCGKSYRLVHVKAGWHTYNRIRHNQLLNNWRLFTTCCAAVRLVVRSRRRFKNLLCRAPSLGCEPALKRINKSASLLRKSVSFCCAEILLPYFVSMALLFLFFFSFCARFMWPLFLSCWFASNFIKRLWNDIGIG